MLVSVVMITYGHEKYIQQAIEGIFMQKTKYAVELIISNDASPDNTDEVINKTINNVPANFEVKYTRQTTNLRMIPNFLWALNQAQGKYIAICEGDDYWTDENKLQKQIDFLESHPEVGLTCTECSRYFQDTDNFLYPKKNYKSREIQLKELLFFNPVVTLTTLFRSEFLIDINMFFQNEFKPEWKMGDYPIWIIIALKAKIKKFSDVTGVYRVLANSASSRNNLNSELQFIQSSFEIKMHFINEFKLDHKFIKIAQRAYIAQSLIISTIHKDKNLANKTFKEMIYKGYGFTFKNLMRYFRAIKN